MPASIFSALVSPGETRRSFCMAAAVDGFPARQTLADIAVRFPAELVAKANMPMFWRGSSERNDQRAARGTKKR